MSAPVMNTQRKCMLNGREQMQEPRDRIEFHVSVLWHVVQNFFFFGNMTLNNFSVYFVYTSASVSVTVGGGVTCDSHQHSEGVGSVNRVYSQKVGILLKECLFK